MLRKKLLLIILFSFSLLPIFAQKIIHADFENKDFSRSKLEIITKKNDQIIVYKSYYFFGPYKLKDPFLFLPENQYHGLNPFNSFNLGSNPFNLIIKSSICIYDSQMKLLTQTPLSLPEEIFGVHFLVYEEYFYMFYQYRKKDIIYCMAAKIGMDGNMIGNPIALDNTVGIVDLRHQSQIYSVVFSENKKNIVAFKMHANTDSGCLLTRILFDSSLNPQSRFSEVVAETSNFYFTEFKVDDKGNLVFVGLNEAKPKANEALFYFFKVSADRNRLSYHPIENTKGYADYFWLTVDNANQKYILSSLGSGSYHGDIDRVNIVILDAPRDSIQLMAAIPLLDRFRQEKKNTKIKLNDFFIQHIQLRADGGFAICAQDLIDFPEIYFGNRWDYLPYLTEGVVDEFRFFDPYEENHYFPWKKWEYFGENHYFNSSSTLVMSFGPDGSAQWMKQLFVNQDNPLYARIGHGIFVSGDLLYLIYNEKIRKNTYLVAQSINAAGALNTDGHLKEHLELKGAVFDYEYFPRLAKQISSTEMIIPFKKGKFRSLAKVTF
ncbi:MAG: hypothetical protein JST58_19470 [Bacteroidetes bacterium]|nr:hypothetical protein [Bacteroidota bacterium]